MVSRYLVPMAPLKRRTVRPASHQSVGAWCGGEPLGVGAGGLSIRLGLRTDLPVTFLARSRYSSSMWALKAVWLWHRCCRVIGSQRTISTKVRSTDLVADLCMSYRV